MTRSPAFTTALVAAIVSALVSLATAGLVLHRAGVSMLGEDMGGSVDDAKMHDYLVKNPEILVEMSTELDKRQAEEQDAKQQKAIGKNAEKIFRSPETPVAANPDGDVTVVEFFDYNCGFCKRAMPEVVKIVGDDKKVRLVLKELPIFGEDSEAAAKATLAAKKQGKYFEMHQKMFSEPGKANLEKALTRRPRARARCRAAEERHGRPVGEGCSGREPRACRGTRHTRHALHTGRRHSCGGRSRRSPRSTYQENIGNPPERLQNHLLGASTRFACDGKSC